MAHIVIDKSKLCTCDCASKCLLGKSGSAHRCSEEQIKEAGHETLSIKTEKVGIFKKEKITLEFSRYKPYNM